MDPILIAAAVVILVQGIKAIFEKWKVKIHGVEAVIITVIVCIGEVIDKVLEAGLPLIAFATLWLLLKVFVGAFGGYSLVKVVANGKNGNVPITVPPAL